MDKVPEMRKSEPDPPVDDAKSDAPEDIVNNLSTEMLDEAFQAECKTWYEMGISPLHHINVDVFKLRCQVEVLIEFLNERKELDLDEFNERMMRKMLFYMISLRREFGRQQLHRALTEGIATPIPQDVKNMIIPTGTKL